MDSLIERITIDDGICNGKPTIRGNRITVQTILEFILAGTSVQEILEQYPVLEQDDLEACKKFALLMMDKKYTLKDVAA